jgi:drug/metabolite transporter (DMT)-like permease
MFPIISALSDSFATVIDKLILKKDNISSKHFTSILFIFMGAFCLPLLFFFEITEVNILSIFILFLIIIGSALQNYLFYVSLSNKDLSSLEPIRNSEPIIIILLAFLVFPDERNFLVLLLGLMTTLALIYSHLDFKNFKKEKVIFDKYSTILIFSIFISAILFIGYKYALEFVNPVTLYSIRTIGVLLFLFTLFKPKLSSLNKTQTSLFTYSAFLYSLSAITQYFAISTVGIGITVLVLALSPIVIYLLSHFVLKESINKHQIIASIVIITCVVIAMVFT